MQPNEITHAYILAEPSAVSRYVPLQCPINLPIASAMFGLQRLGIECEFFTWAQLKHGKLDHLKPTTIVLGGVEAVLLALQKLGKPVPPPLDYPQSLRSFLGRTVTQMSLAAAMEEPLPVFIKSVGHKVLDGVLYVSDAQRRNHLGQRAYETPKLRVWVSPKVDLQAEARVFVHKGKIIGIHPYENATGWSQLPPAFPKIMLAVEAYQKSGEAPSAYTLDFGIAYTGTEGRLEPLLVEVNDGFAFGPYGLPQRLHVDMLLSRWAELMG